MSLLTRISAGTVGGLVGSVLMGVVYAGAHEAGLMGTPPPERVTEGLLRRAGIRVRGKEEQQLAVVAHLGFGAAGGTIYGALAPKIERAANAVTLGALYGTAIYLVSYAGWVPALGLMPPPDRDDPGRQVVALVNHWIYGACLGLAVHATDDRRGGATGR